MPRESGPRPEIHSPKIRQMNPDSADAHPTMAFDAIEMRAHLQREATERGMDTPSVVLSPEIEEDAHREFGDTLLGQAPVFQQQNPPRAKGDSAQRFQAPPARLLEKNQN